MDIALSHILHRKILTDLKKDIENKYSPVRDITVINTEPKKEKNCSQCGQSIYFCACSDHNSRDNDLKSLSNK